MADDNMLIFGLAKKLSELHDKNTECEEERKRLEREIEQLKEKNSILREILDPSLVAEVEAEEDEEPDVWAVVRPWAVGGRPTRIGSGVARSRRCAASSVNPAGSASAPIYTPSVVSFAAIISSPAISTSASAHTFSSAPSPSTSAAGGHFAAPSTSGHVAAPSTSSHVMAAASGHTAVAPASPVGRIATPARNTVLRSSRSQTDLSRSLLKASKLGRVDKVERLLDKGADLLYRDSCGWSALHIASHCGQAEVLRLLLNKGVPVHLRTNWGNTALHFAAANGTAECVQILLGAGARIHVRDDNGDTPLHRAAWTNNKGTVRALLCAGASTEMRNNNDQRPRSRANSVALCCVL